MVLAKPDPLFFQRILLPEQEKTGAKKNIPALPGDFSSLEGITKTFPGTFKKPCLLNGEIHSQLFAYYDGLADHIAEMQTIVSSHVSSETELLSIIQTLKNRMCLAYKRLFPNSNPYTTLIISDIFLAAKTIYSQGKSTDLKHEKIAFAIFALAKFSQFVANQTRFREPLPKLHEVGQNPRWYSMENKHHEKPNALISYGEVLSKALLGEDTENIVIDPMSFAPPGFETVEPLREGMWAVRVISGLTGSIAKERSVELELSVANKAAQLKEFAEEQKKWRSKGGQAKNSKYENAKQLVHERYKNIRTNDPTITRTQAAIRIRGELRRAGAFPFKDDDAALNTIYTWLSDFERQNPNLKKVLSAKQKLLSA